MSPTDPQAALLEYEPKTDALAGKVIVVTGAGSGIGRACALGFAQCGATCVLLGRTLASLEATYDRIEDEGGPQPAIFPINFESAVSEDYAQLARVLKETFGRVDGLLHNAAVLGVRSPISHFNVQTWQQVLQINLTAPFMLTQALLPLLRASHDGRILFTGSGVGHRGRAYWGAYAAAKAGVENLMQTLADEREDTSVRVNSINPGATRTAMRAEAYPGEHPEAVTPPETLLPRYIYLFSADSQAAHGERFDAQPPLQS